MQKTMQKVGDNISLSRKESVAIIFIRNNLSYQTADELRVAYEKIKDNKILVDLGGVTITTSRGMATLIAIILDAEERNQKVCLCNVSRACMNIIDAMDIMSHVTELKIFETIDEGMDYFQSL